MNHTQVEVHPQEVHPQEVHPQVVRLPAVQDAHLPVNCLVVIHANQLRRIIRYHVTQVVKVHV